MTEQKPESGARDAAAQVAAAADAIARDEAERARLAAASAPPRRQTPPWVAAVALLALIASLVANWNALRGPALDPNEERTESMRTLEYIADRVSAAATTVGALPLALDSLGLGGSEVAYSPSADGFRLSMPLASGDTVSLTRSFTPGTRP